jgi:RES domain-containing protein
VEQRSLVAAIDELGADALEADAFRHVSPGRNPVSGAGARIFGGRWNPPESFPTLYLGLTVRTILDEFVRMARRQALLPEAFLPREQHRIHVELERALDLRPPDARSALRLADEHLRGDDLTHCQAIGAAAHSLGLEGIVAPSAAGSGEILAVYLDTLRPDSVVEHIELEAVWHDVRDT